MKSHLEVYGGGEGSGDELAEMAAQEFATEELSGFLKFLARHHSNRFSVGAPPDHQIVLRSRAPDLTVEEKARREREMKSVVNAVTPISIGKPPPIHVKVYTVLEEWIHELESVHSDAQMSSTISTLGWGAVLSAVVGGAVYKLENLPTPLIVVFSVALAVAALASVSWYRQSKKKTSALERLRSRPYETLGGTSGGQRQTS